PSLDKMRTLIQTLLFDSSFLTEEVLQERYESSLDPDVIRIMRDSAPGREDLSDQLHKVACPSLIVWGLDDRFGALDIGLLMARMSQTARMHILAQCGHGAQVEHADEFSALVLVFRTRGSAVGVGGGGGGGCSLLRAPSTASVHRYRPSMSVTVAMAGARLLK